MKWTFNPLQPSQNYASRRLADCNQSIITDTPDHNNVYKVHLSTEPVSSIPTSTTCTRLEWATTPSGRSLVRKWQLLVWLFREGRNIKCPSAALQDLSLWDDDDYEKVGGPAQNYTGWPQSQLPSDTHYTVMDWNLKKAACIKFTIEPKWSRQKVLIKMKLLKKNYRSLSLQT